MASLPSRPACASTSDREEDRTNIAVITGSPEGKESQTNMIDYLALEESGEQEGVGKCVIKDDDMADMASRTEEIDIFRMMFLVQGQSV